MKMKTEMKRFRLSWVEVALDRFDNECEREDYEDIEANDEKEALLIWAMDRIKVEEIKEVPKNFKMLVEKNIQAFYPIHTNLVEKDKFIFSATENNKVRYSK